MTQPAVRVLVSDDQTLFRAGLARLLDEDDRIEIVGQAGNGEEAVELAQQLEPDVVLMDLRMPKLDGVGATRAIKAARGETKVLMLTTFAGDEQVLDALSAGADGYVLKDAPPETIAASLVAVRAGGRVMAPSIADRVLDRLVNEPIRARDGLTRRETEILKLLAAGLPNKQIGYRLAISEKTVRNHVSNIYEKLQIFDRAQAVLYAVRRGLIEV